MDKIICIYHGSCIDGFTAAWVVRQALVIDQEKNVEFYAGYYQTKPPDVTDKIVYMVDFSYKNPVMLDMLKTAKRIIHIDHHVSAITDMESVDLPNLEKFYSKDNTASGAMLAWQYFYPQMSAPAFVQHIDDRDRWQFRLDGTREVNAVAFSYEYDFANWDYMISRPIEELKTEGKAILRRHNKDIKELATVVVRRMMIDNYVVPVANVPYQYGSELCNILCQGEPFAAYYYDKPDGREFGLRSNEDGVDVSEIAKKFGGGGHRNASGFRLSRARSEQFEL